MHHRRIQIAPRGRDPDGTTATLLLTIEEVTRDRCLRYQGIDGPRNEQLPGAATATANTTAIFNIVVSIASRAIDIVVRASGILHGAGVIFVVAVVVVIIVVIVVVGFLGSGAILALAVLVAVAFAVAIIDITLVVVVLAVIGLARGLLGPFVMLVGLVLPDVGQLAIPQPAARSTTADYFDLPVLRRRSLVPPDSAIR